MKKVRALLRGEDADGDRRPRHDPPRVGRRPRSAARSADLQRSRGIDTPAVGARVLVPVGARTITGCVIVTDEAAGDDPRPMADGLRDLIDVLDGEPFLPADVIDLAAGWPTTTPAGRAKPWPRPCLRWPGWRAGGSVAITEEGSRAVAGGPGPTVSALARRVLETAAAARSLPESTLRTRLNRAAAGASGTRPAARVRAGRARAARPPCDLAGARRRALSRTRPSASSNSRRRGVTCRGHARMPAGAQARRQAARVAGGARGGARRALGAGAACARLRRGRPSPAGPPRAREHPAATRGARPVRRRLGTDGTARPRRRRT